MEGDAPVRIPGFELLRELGRGAMGVVYLAHERSLGRDVALKVLKDDLTQESDVRARFEREVRAAARLRHPGIVPILSTGEADGHLWYAMEYVAGESLDDVLHGSESGRIHRARAARVVAEVARALDGAHQEGVTHRDVKPGNILLVQESVPATERDSPSRRLRASWVRWPVDESGTPRLERPMLTDFGLAMDTTASKLSQSGMLIGTPGYMAPEQFAGTRDAVGPAADQWGLGVALYECLTGRLPFPTDDLPTLARFVTDEPPVHPSLLDPRVDRELETICLKCLEKDPRERYPSCAALADDLSNWLLERPISARPPGLWRRLKARGRRHPVRAAAVIAALVVVLAALAVLAGLRISRASRITELAEAAHAALDERDHAAAVDLYGEWIALDPGAPEPRDGRERARALGRIDQAEQTFEQAVARITALRADRERAVLLAAQSAKGQDATGGTGLGAENARGSEPWWMREPGYRAGIELEALEQRLAESRAQIAATLEVARSLVDGSYELAGERGRQVRDWIRSGAAAWHMEQWRRAMDEDDEQAAVLHRVAVMALGPESYVDELSGRQTVRIAAVGPGATGWLFRFEREADVIDRGGPRLLPLPFSAGASETQIPEAYAGFVGKRLEGEGRRRVEPDVPSVATPGESNALFVGTVAGPMRRTRYDALLASSAYPLEATAANRLPDLAADVELTLDRGRYMLLVRSGGRDVRIPFEVHDAVVLTPGAAFAPAEPPDGMVWVPPGSLYASALDPGGDADGAPTWQDVGGFFASRFEVTYEEYWAFLNDPRTLAEISAHAGNLRFVPRYGTSSIAGPSGQFYAPMGNPEHPAMYLSLFDFVGYLPSRDEDASPWETQLERLVEALARSETIGWGYLRWRTERSRANARIAKDTGEVGPDVAVVVGSGGAREYRAMHFTLPTVAEWERMARGGDRRRFVYGDEREWTYFKGARSRTQYPCQEAIGLFPDDESVFGVRDLTGSVSEWTSDWRSRREAFVVKGAAWSDVETDADEIDARSARAPGEVSSTIGFRVIVRVLESDD